MFSIKHAQVVNRVKISKSQLHDAISGPAIALPCISQRSLSSSEPEPEKEPRFRAFNSFKTFHGARNQLISGKDYSFVSSDKDVPFGSKERQRLKLQQQLAADVLRLLREIEYAKQRGGLVGEERRQDEQRQQLIQNKLKSKAHLEIDPSSGQVKENSKAKKGEK